MINHLTLTPPEVRAVMREIENEGSGKSQFRAVIKPHEGDELIRVHSVGWVWCDQDGLERPFEPPHWTGQRIWVREAWRTYRCHDDMQPVELPKNPANLWYSATHKNEPHGFDHRFNPGKQRRPQHMPLWASRITLTVETVRVQRLHGISDRDAIAECFEGLFGSFPDDSEIYAADLFKTDYTTRHGPDAWAVNPWVCAVTFKPELKNIEEYE